MKWLELCVDVPPEFVEPISHIFYKYGYGGVSIESPADFNPDEGEVAPVPETFSVRTYIPKDDSTDERRANIEIGVKLINHLHPIEPLKETEIKDEDWETNWKQYFHPIRVGRKLVICPTWQEHASLRDDVIIFLDPGMAFGTGHHPTTRMCMELLEDTIVGGEKIIDLGCGSGILSVTAVKLGALSSIGFEIESNASKVAKENCVLNGVDESVEVFNSTLPDNRYSEGDFDLALANISAKVIIELADHLTKGLRSGGKLILSGVLENALEDVRDVFEPLGVVFEKVMTDSDWTAVLATKK
ncbi:MAG: 50S ribosomal protein L11 methyltransferase [Chloroflexota bacterium]|nr:50S ribosomal protein L11 methyltransferase [Chloroflexota bacterium]